MAGPTREGARRPAFMQAAPFPPTAPGWLQARGYPFRTDLEQALAAWRDETDGTFV